MLYTFTIMGAPRTKKTSNRIVRAGAFSKVLPSEAHEAWFKEAMSQAVLIQRFLRAQGLEQTIDHPVAVAAIFYRDRNVGDLCGYLQSLGDFMQAPKVLPSGKISRNGAGIIGDDSQIVSWDGSRLRKDSVNPRIDVAVQVLENYVP